MSRHPEADLMDSVTPDLDDPQAKAIEEVLQEAEPPPSVIREMHQRMKEASAEGRQQRRARKEMP